MTPKKRETGLVIDVRYLDHHMGPGQVENPQRLQAVYSALAEGEPLPCRMIAPRTATREDLELIHAPEYIGLVAGTAGREYVMLDGDTAATALTYETALLAAGGVLEAADAVVRGDVRNAFALIRPPGHHAETNQAKGFCFFNNAAIAAEHLLRRRGLKKVLVADWDLHHGNGTQHTFYSRRDVLFFSTHQSPLYPGTGSLDETGCGEGLGFTVNVPLRSGKTDRDFLFVYRHILGPIAEEFQPDFIIVSAGYDIFEGDPLGGMLVTEDGFAALAGELTAQAENLCEGRLLLVLEGGYNLDGLARGVIRTLGQMTGRDASPAVIADISITTQKEITPVIETQRSFWPL